MRIDPEIYEILLSRAHAEEQRESLRREHPGKWFFAWVDRIFGPYDDQIVAAGFCKSKGLAGRAYYFRP